MKIIDRFYLVVFFILFSFNEGSIASEKSEKKQKFYSENQEKCQVFFAALHAGHQYIISGSGLKGVKPIRGITLRKRFLSPRIQEEWSEFCEDKVTRFEKTFFSKDSED